MSLVSLPIFCALMVAAVIYWSVPPRARTGVLLTVGVLFAASQASVFVPLYVVLALVTWAVAGRLGRLRAAGASVRLGFIATLGMLLANLVAWKVFEVPAHTAVAAAPELSRLAFPGYSDVFVPVGLSFLTFRLVHVLVERTRGRLPPASAPRLLAWLLFPPLLIAGPLQRFGDFEKQRQTAQRPRLPALNQAVLRIVVGLVKKLVVADTLGHWAQPLLHDPQTAPPHLLAVAIYAASFQLYMDFSGYSDIAIGLGRLFGVRVPENFDWPILATDIATFWRKWHITLHTFFRDYVFLPIFGVRARPLKTYFGLLVTIFLFQIWHQFSPAFLFLGLFHGVGVVSVHAFRATRRRWPRVHRQLRRTPRWVAIGLTFTWFSLGNVVFMSDPSHLLAVLRRLADLPMG